MPATTSWRRSLSRRSPTRSRRSEHKVAPVMRRLGRPIALSIVLAVAADRAAHAQGRGGPNWTTTSSDAQRTSWVKTDPRISRESLQKPGFQLLWKTKLENQPRQLESLTQPILLSNIISYKGFKALAFIGGSSDNVYSIDYDLNKIFWKRHLNALPPAGGTIACPGAMTTITRATPLGQAAPAPPAGERRPVRPTGVPSWDSIGRRSDRRTGSHRARVRSPPRRPPSTTKAGTSLWRRTRTAGCTSSMPRRSAVRIIERQPRKRRRTRLRPAISRRARWRPRSTQTARAGYLRPPEDRCTRRRHLE